MKNNIVNSHLLWANGIDEEPSFHDAEVTGVSLQILGGAFPANPVALVNLRILMPRGTAYSDPQRPITALFKFEECSDIEISCFAFQNPINAFEIFELSLGEQKGFSVSFEPVSEFSMNFKCTRVEILSITPDN